MTTRASHLIALIAVAGLACEAWAQTRAKAPTMHPTHTTPIRQRIARPGGVIQRQVNQDMQTLRARQQQLRDVSRLTSPALPGTGVPAGLSPRDALTRRLIALQRPAQVRSFSDELGLLSDQSPEVLGIADAYIVPEGGKKTPLKLEYTRVFQVRPDTRARATNAMPMDRVIAALSGAPLLTDAQYNDRDATYRERYEALESRFGQQGFEPVWVGDGQVRFVRPDDPELYALPSCGRSSNLPQPAKVDGATHPRQDELPYPTRDEGSFIPVLDLSDQVLGMTEAPMHASAVARASTTAHTPTGARPMPMVDSAVVALQRGKTDLAVDLLEARVAANADDASAVRLLGMARLVKGETAEGMRLIDQAYRLDPALARVPPDVHAFPGDRRGCRKALVEIVKLGHALDDPRAWLAAAVLMQAEGRTRPAQRMIDRARAGGLEAEVADAMDAALRPAQR